MTDSTWEQPAPQPTKKPFYKRWWFITPIAIIVIAVAFIAAMFWIAGKQEQRAEEVALAQCKLKIEQYSKYPGGISYPSDPVFNTFP